MLVTVLIQDPRFNTDVDKLTGYRTKSILCMPITAANNQVQITITLQTLILRILLVMARLVLVCSTKQ